MWGGWSGGRRAAAWGGGGFGARRHAARALTAPPSGTGHQLRASGGGGARVRRGRRWGLAAVGQARDGRGALGGSAGVWARAGSRRSGRGAMRGRPRERPGRKLRPPCRWVMRSSLHQRTGVVHPVIISDVVLRALKRAVGARRRASPGRRLQRGGDDLPHRCLARAATYRVITLNTLRLFLAVGAAFGSV